MTQFQWHILGPGAIGSLFACHLQKAQLNTALVARTPSEDARLITLEYQGKLDTCGFKIDKGPQPFQHLLVTVKAHQTEQALLENRHRINADTVVILLQNGMGSWQILEREFPTTVFLLATTTEGAYRARDHHIVHAGKGSTWIGCLQPQWQATVRAVLKQWSNLDLNLHPDANIEARLWQKLAINCAINPLTVLYDCKNGDLLKNKTAVEQMRLICAEVEQVWEQQLGAPPHLPLIDMAMEVAVSTSENLSSMLQDYRQGKTTEIDFINGYLVRKAHQAGLSVPTNERILAAVKGMSF